MAFDPFGDHTTREYLRNVAGELDPERVKCLEHSSFLAGRIPKDRRDLNRSDVPCQ
jgi:hypothetical protein